MTPVGAGIIMGIATPITITATPIMTRLATTISIRPMVPNLASLPACYEAQSRATRW